MATLLGSAAAARRLRQVRPGPAAVLAARRDGGPDPGVGADPRGDHGDRRRLPDRPVQRDLRRAPRPRRPRWSSSARSRCCSARSSAAPRTTSRRSLAGSTMSQIGYMILAAGLGPAGYAFAIFHLLTHGFFKAGMFLGAGSVMHGMNDEVDMRRYGALRKYMPVTFVTFACRLPGDHRHPAVLRLLLQGPDHRGGVRAQNLVVGLWRAARRRHHRVLHDPADADDLLRREALGEGRAPARVADGDDGPADRARRLLGVGGVLCCSTTGSWTGSSRSSGHRGARARRSAAGDDR